jgi:hypothetical protein
VKAFTSFDQLLEVAREEKPKDGFAAIISNPPYQEQSSSLDSNNAATNVFQHFYEVSSCIGLHISMVFPGGRWMQRSGASREIANLLFSNLKSVDWYRNGDEKEGRELFVDARIRDGVSIVYANTQKISPKILWNGIEVDRPTGDVFYPLQKEMHHLVEKICKSPNRVKSRKLPRNPFGLNSAFVELNPEKVELIENRKIPTIVNPMKAYLADGARGSGKTVREYWIGKESISWTPFREKLSTQWKVIGGQGGVAKDPQNENYRVIDNKHLVGETYFVVGHFNTEEEARNYALYLNSKTVKKLLEASKGGKLVQWGVFVPDLENYLSDSLDWSQPIDPQLYRLFSLSDEDIAIIEGSF